MREKCTMIYLIVSLKDTRSLFFSISKVFAVILTIFQISSKRKINIKAVSFNQLKL